MKYKFEVDTDSEEEKGTSTKMMQNKENKGKNAETGATSAREILKKSNIPIRDRR